MDTLLLMGYNAVFELITNVLKLGFVIFIIVALCIIIRKRKK